MKYLFILATAVVSFQCSPRLAPDSNWGGRRWVVTELKGVPVQVAGGRRDAFINFQTHEKKFSGNGGCNQVNGTYSLDRNDISFTEVISTEMSCDNIQFENTFLSTLRSINRYEVKTNQIILKRKRETLIVLTAR